MSDPAADRIAEFEEGYGFRLDPFQREAIESLLAGRSVLVAAPTGAGKTVVGEFACWQALRDGTKTFYTTPIKALSNQKYRDLCRKHGESNVGLLTGDRSINGEAPIVVMTTEIVRNMLYERSSTLTGLRYVVLDEVHYLQDRERGAVWEEVIIHLPASVQLASLSATVSNAEEFGEWLAEAREGCDVVIEESRPVPLRHHYYLNDRIYPTFVAGKKKGASSEHRERAAQALAGVPNPDIVMLERRARTKNRVTNKGRRVSGSGVKLRYPDRTTVVDELYRRKWLPAILFVFSRAGCEDAVSQLVRAGLRLTSKEEAAEIAQIADEHTAEIPDADLAVLGFAAWRDALMRGAAAHHAGLVPAFKEAVEVCFQRGLLKVVVATETLALGINMPAKTVVIERLEKWNGERHVLLTPGQYTQLTGRAGRRGIDDIGHAVVLYQRNIDFSNVAGLVGTRSYPLTSSFAPSYNMAVNLLRHRSRRESETLLGASFAQFQTDRSLAGTGKRLAELEDGMRGYSPHLQCHLGDWESYWALRSELSSLEKDSKRARTRAAEDAIASGIASLVPGQVIYVDGMPRRGLLAVVGLQVTKRGTVLAQVVSEDRALFKLGPRELDHAPVVAGRIKLPSHGNPRQRQYRDEVGGRLRGVDPPPPPVVKRAREPEKVELPPEVDVLRTQLRAHPCHECQERDDHERWQYRYDKLAKEASRLRRSHERRTGSLVRQFDQIVRVLEDLGYLAEDQPTEEGLQLARIYSEADLLVAEALRRGYLEGLTAGEVAGFAAFIVYVPRGGELTPDFEVPTAPLKRALGDVVSLASEIRAMEKVFGLDPFRELDGGFVAAAYRWAQGADLDDALGDLELPGGDFVRNIRQVADLVGQLRDVGDADLRANANTALDQLRRGIVDA